MSEKTNEQREYAQYAIYKPAKSGNGSAVQFKLSEKKDTVFLYAGKQLNKESKAMDWDKDKVIIIALKLPDLQSLIHTLELKKSRQKSGELEIGCELYHQTDKGSKTIKLATNAQQPGFYMTIFFKPSDGDNRNVGIPITPEESTGLSLALKDAFVKILNF